jgi:predicted SprT family Zn-dependent metalloprotease
MHQIIPLAEFGNSGKIGVYTPTPSEQVYVPLLKAFNHFNRTLFKGELPDALITLQRKRGIEGYFHADTIAAVDGDARIDEIAMNPVYSRMKTKKDICDTLVHEICHLWQVHFGERPRAGYHDRQWAAKMREIGLQPSSTGAPGGRETGYRMSDYVIPGGLFDQAFAAFEATGAAIAWGDVLTHANEKQKSKRDTYVCPGCDLKALCVPNKRIICGECNLPMIARGKVLPDDEDLHDDEDPHDEKGQP